MVLQSNIRTSKLPTKMIDTQHIELDSGDIVEVRVSSSGYVTISHKTGNKLDGYNWETLKNYRS